MKYLLFLMNLSVIYYAQSSNSSKIGTGIVASAAAASWQSKLFGKEIPKTKSGVSNSSSNKPGSIKKNVNASSKEAASETNLVKLFGDKILTISNTKSAVHTTPTKASVPIKYGSNGYFSPDKSDKTKTYVPNITYGQNGYFSQERVDAINKEKQKSQNNH